MLRTSTSVGNRSAAAASLALAIGPAEPADANALASLHAEVAATLTRIHGDGHWSSSPTERAVLRAIVTSSVLVARIGGRLAGTLRLATKKPWAIDPVCFTPVRRALYLLDMAVEPELQRHGIGRALIAGAVACARAFPSAALRLDAYDAPAGAAGFYTAVGFENRGRKEYRGTPLVYFELVLGPAVGTIRGTDMGARACSE